MRPGSSLGGDLESRQYLKFLEFLQFAARDSSPPTTRRIVRIRSSRARSVSRPYLTLLRIPTWPLIRVTRRGHLFIVNLDLSYLHCTTSLDDECLSLLCSKRCLLDDSVGQRRHQIVAPQTTLHLKTGPSNLRLCPSRTCTSFQELESPTPFEHSSTAFLKRG